MTILMVDISYGQNEPFQYTEAQIAIQDKYVEAKKYMLIGRFEKAEEILTALYKEDRSNAAVSMELSKVYSYLEDPYNEHRYAQKAHESYPTNEYVLARYAQICTQQEKTGEAIPLLTKLVNISPCNEEYTDLLATNYLKDNNADAAIAAYDAIEVRIGVTEDVSRRKYEIYEILGKEKQALAELEKIASANPYDVRYLHNVAAYQTKMGKSSDALATYKKILEVDINDAKANMAITTGSGAGGDDNNYLRSLTPILENASIPVDRKVLELIPYVDQLNQEYDAELADALIMLTDKISVIHADDAKSHALKGDVLYTTGKLKSAAKSYEKTLSLDNKVYPVWENLMSVYSDLDDITNLKRVATDALDYYPNMASAYMYYGRANSLSGNATEAAELLEEGVFVSGKDVTAKSNIYAELGRAYAALGKKAEANEAVLQALSLSQNQNPLALEIYGDLLASDGKKSDAVKQWKEALKMGAYPARLDKKIAG